MLLNIPISLWNKMLFLAREPEIGAMGVVTPYANSRELLLTELHVTKQQVTAASVDMELVDWTEYTLLTGLKKSLAPWQFHFWFHSHPKGVNSFSGTDKATIRDPNGMGAWEFLIAAVLTGDMHFFGEVYNRFQPIVGELVSSTTQLEYNILWEPSSLLVKEWQAEVDRNVAKIISKPFLREEEELPWWNHRSNYMRTTLGIAHSSVRSDSKESEL